MEEKSWLERHWKKWLPAALSLNAALSVVWWAGTDDWFSALAGFNAGAVVCAGMVGVALRRARRRARDAAKRKADEAEVDLNDLKTRLEEIGAEAFDDEVSKIQVRVPSMHPPPSEPVRSVSELLAEDVDPEIVGEMLAAGRARRD
ncbi:hypothetical protein EDM68_03565 [Candidatus Uhrbacteria bacterium]|nr:MAG: hypothetical protein EDM68_03565 [Candidatus Uhrbacteria bacterium]